MTLDPVATNPDHYSVIFENDHVRVLEYLDQPGDSTTPHVIFVELKDSATAPPSPGALGPS